MTLQTLAFSAAFLVSFAEAGEIIIQPASNQTRTEKEASRSATSARQRLDGQKAPVVIEDGTLDGGSRAQRSSQDAQEYLRSSGGQAPSDEKTTIILRSVPLSDSEKSRQRAASYVQPSGSSATQRACGDVSLTVGSIGDKTTVDRNVVVNERGNSAVNVNCKK